MNISVCVSFYKNKHVLASISTLSIDAPQLRFALTPICSKVKSIVP